MIRIFFPLAFLFSIYVHGYAQSDFTSGGGDASGIGGEISFSIGQVAYTNMKDESGQVSLGVQQSYLSIMVSNEETGTVFTTGLFPNPVQKELYVTLHDSADTRLKEYSFLLTDVSGRKIMSGELQNDITNISVEALQGGIYLLQVMHRDISIQTFKVIKTQ
jgi:hypothetical protein